MGRWDRELIEQLPKSVKVSASAGAGFDWVDTDILAESGELSTVFCAHQDIAFVQEQSNARDAAQRVRIVAERYVGQESSTAMEPEHLPRPSQTWRCSTLFPSFGR